MNHSQAPNSHDLDVKPWYRQFWPWFLIALPGSVVIASLVTVFIAFQHADTLVVDSYYRKGLAINQVLEQDKLAASLGLTADVRVDATSGELFVTLKGADAPPGQLTLMLLHPTDEERDRTLAMISVSAGHYRVDLDQQLQYRYYLRLLPEPKQEWRLAGELDFSLADQVTLRAQ